MLLLAAISTGRDVVSETMVVSLAPGRHVLDQFRKTTEVLYRMAGITASSAGEGGGTAAAGAASPGKKPIISLSLPRIWLLFELKRAQLAFLQEACLDSEAKSAHLLVSHPFYSFVDLVARDLEEFLRRPNKHTMCFS